MKESMVKIMLKTILQALKVPKLVQKRTGAIKNVKPQKIAMCMTLMRKIVNMQCAIHTEDCVDPTPECKEFSSGLD